MTADTSGVDRERIPSIVTDLIVAFGEDPARPGLAATPRRVAEAWGELLAGTGLDPAAELAEGAFPPEQDSGVVALRDIPFRSVCEHHLLPFEGRIGIAYLPGELLAGFSRIVRAVDAVASRLQVQERLTEELADAVVAALAPRGVVVTASAAHACLWARGTRTREALAVTVAARGELAEPSARGETLALLIGQGGADD
ncbi:MAG: cyclohydrolase [Mycetocola sp.]|nr:cyclohydrolase [Mycetocola sp.]